MNTLTLSITHLSQLPHGIKATHRFDTAGGTIGSAGAHWRISDGGVAPIHCEIRWTEGRFCVIDRCNRTYLNDEACSLGQRSPRSLRAGDVLRVGRYRLQVQAQREPGTAGSLEALFSAERQAFEKLLADTPVPVAHTEPAAPVPAVDPCTYFTPELGHDPLAALDATAPKTPGRACPLSGERP